MARKLYVLYTFADLLDMPTSSAIPLYLGRIQEDTVNMALHNGDLKNRISQLENQAEKEKVT